MDEHTPVLLEEVIDGLHINADGTYCDLTLGRGGHSSAILKKLRNGKLISFDQDIVAIKSSEERLKKVSNNFTLIHANFASLKCELQKINVTSIDGAMMDLGVSSPQFDTPERGFSYRYDAPLDMRMNQDQALTAADIVNNYDIKELTNIFRAYGDEKYAYEIAKNIVKKREVSPLQTTFELVDVIKSSLPMKELNKKGHPAKQVFQALRIETNDELNVLKVALKDALSLLKVGGRLAVITFHSGEDRIVKTIFKEVTTIEGNRHLPMQFPNQDDKPKFRLVNKKVITASAQEQERNPRSVSAKLRIIERI